MTCEIRRNREHLVVYINGEFYCTADNEREAAKEIENYIEERRDQNETQSS